MAQCISMSDSHGKADIPVIVYGNIECPDTPFRSADLSAGLISSCARRMWLHAAVSGKTRTFESVRHQVPQQVHKINSRHRVQGLCTAAVIGKNVKRLCESHGKTRVRLRWKCGESFWYATNLFLSPCNGRQNSPRSSTFTPQKVKCDISSAAMNRKLDWRTYDVGIFTMPQVQTPLACNGKQT